MKTAITLLSLALLVSQAIAQDTPKDSGTDPNIRPTGEVTLRFERNIEVSTKPAAEVYEEKVSKKPEKK